MSNHGSGWENDANYGDHPDHDGHLSEPHPEHYHPDDQLPHDSGSALSGSHEYGDHLYHPGNIPVDEAAGHWHEPYHDQGSGIASQESVLAHLTGTPHNEAELVAIATDNDWYIEGGGTPLYDIGSLIEYFDVPVESGHYSQLEDLEVALAEGQDVLVALGSGGSSYSDVAPDMDMDDYPGIPGQDPGRVVQVTGVDRGDPVNPAVLLNDPGLAAAGGQALPLQDFLDAWADYDNFAVIAGSRSDA
jgi:hypothetical protein